MGIQHHTAALGAAAPAAPQPNLYPKVPPADVFLLSPAALHSLATEAVVALGVRSADDACVTNLSAVMEGRTATLLATVDAGHGTSHEVEVAVALAQAPQQRPRPIASAGAAQHIYAAPHAGLWVADPASTMRCDCDCDFAWQPFCPHGIAALVAWRRTLESGDQLAGAEYEAIQYRRQRAAAEVKVTGPRRRGGWGSWVARSLRAEGEGPTWRVELVNTQGRFNSCTCPDFELNELNTCKHIEAVILHEDKHRRRPPARAVVWLNWQPSGADATGTHEGTSQPRPALHLQGRPSAESLAAIGPLRRLLGDTNHGENTAETTTSAEALATAVLALAQATADAAPTRSEAGKSAVQRRRQTTPSGRQVVVTHAALRWAQRTLAAEAARLRRAEVEVEVRLHGRQQPGIKAQLYPHQIDGVAFLASHGRALLADDMGLGKTLQAIAAAQVLMRRGEVRRTLVVCPASLKHQWAAEIRRFTGQEVEVIGSGARHTARSREAQLRKRAAFTVINYERVMRDQPTIQASLAPDLLVLDEAQRIRNWKTKTAAAVKRLRTPYAFVLTGTPLENRLSDIYSLMQVVDPTLLGPLWRFAADHEVRDRWGKPIASRDLAGLRRKLQRLMLRRGRAIIATQLPSRRAERRTVELDAKQEAMHKRASGAMKIIMQQAQKEGRQLTPSERERFLRALQIARMACNAAGLVDGVTEGSPKLTELVALVRRLWLEEGRKLVVFSQFAKMTAMAERALAEIDVPALRLHGAVPTERRGELIRRFEEDDSIGVFLSTDAGGTGLNLQAASVVIHLELPFNPAVLAQRDGRVYRLGQRRDCLSVTIMAAGSVEEQVVATLRGKRALFSAVISGELSDNVVGTTVSALTATIDAQAAAEPQPPLPGRSKGPDLPADVVVEDGAPPTTSAAAPDQRPTASAHIEVMSGELTVNERAANSDHVAPELGAPSAVAIPRGQATLLRGQEGSVAPLIARIQAVLGARVERMQVAGAGLMVLVRDADAACRDAVARAVAELSEADPALAFPVAVVDAATWQLLGQLGATGPTSPATAIEGKRTSPPADEASPPRSGLLRLATDKLRAAALLCAGDCVGEALTLLLAGSLAGLAAGAGATQPPALEDALSWAYGLGRDDDAGTRAPTEAELRLLTQIVGLRSAGDHVPQRAVAPLIAEARRCWLAPYGAP